MLEAETPIWWYEARFRAALQMPFSHIAGSIAGITKEAMDVAGGFPQLLQFIADGIEVRTRRRPTPLMSRHMTWF